MGHCFYFSFRILAGADPETYAPILGAEAYRELREETRELDQAAGAISPETYAQRGAELGVTQAELAAKTRGHPL